MSSLLKNVRIISINQNLVSMDYVIRGPLVIRAAEIDEEIASGISKPFEEVIRAHFGDLHSMGQEPITFLRQVLALCVHPELMESVDYPEDAKQRARTILNGCSGGSIGSYTNSSGITPIRQQVANFILERDGYETDFNDIVLTAGATPGIKTIISMLNCVVDGKKPGIMVPIPLYPLYSSTVCEFGMSWVGYYLDEANNWALDVNELRRALFKARKDLAVRAIVIINPGNPTGQVLTSENIMDIIRFAHEEKLIILADEVYQNNIYDKHSKFYSFKKTMTEMGQPFSHMEIASFMSTSKGYLGECGIRGGYMELCNFDPKVKAVLMNSIAAILCPTTAGQVAISVLVNPPKPSEQSYNVYIKEKSAVLDSLKVRAELVYKSFNTFDGFSCNKVQGAMYAFPQIKMPQKAIDAAFKAKMEPDEFYAFDLLESTGICIIPGCGFGQKPGSYHFRTTILPPLKKLKIMLSKFHKFHTAFLEKYK